jgi:hypothetical protein
MGIAAALYYHTGVCYHGLPLLGGTRACLQLSKIIAEAKWTPARKFLASLS